MSTVLVHCALLCLGADAPATATDSLIRQPSLPRFVMRRMGPPDQAVMQAGVWYLIEVEGELEPSPNLGMELTLSLVVNGAARSPARLVTTAGVSAKGRWTWAVRSCDPLLTVELIVSGVASDASVSEFVREKRSYVVLGRCRRCCLRQRFAGCRTYQPAGFGWVRRRGTGR